MPVQAFCASHWISDAWWSPHTPSLQHRLSVIRLPPLEKPTWPPTKPASCCTHINLTVQKSPSKKAKGKQIRKRELLCACVCFELKPCVFALVEMKPSSCSWALPAVSSPIKQQLMSCSFHKLKTSCSQQWLFLLCLQCVRVRTRSAPAHATERRILGLGLFHLVSVCLHAAFIPYFYFIEHNYRCFKYCYFVPALVADIFQTSVCGVWFHGVAGVHGKKRGHAF